MLLQPGPRFSIAMPLNPALHDGTPPRRRSHHPWSLPQRRPPCKCQPHLLFCMTHCRALAPADEWRPLAEALRDLRRRLGLHHCTSCHQRFAKDIFRHPRRQHPLKPALETERRNSVAARSPCSWCSAHAGYKTQHVPALFCNRQLLFALLLIRHVQWEHSACGAAVERGQKWN